ncbi:CAPN15 [Symbiodinium pilosum]|uniref:CAPN15 protein n=1 Tax=Symbiodinium pilosum TaxID=2952 RepID=A0A812SXK9_SYMPI|nr:CAPN15 [Symbiodinium pilosum]
MFNDLPVYERGYPEANIFYGWTEDGKKQGWFVASRVPKSGSVKRYKMFNPSSHAAGPHLCTAIWRNPSGKLDKRLFCMAERREAWEETEARLLYCRELWDGVPEQFQVDESMHDALEDEWEHEWQEEAGEGVEDFGPEGYELMYEGGEEPAPDDDFAEVWEDPHFPPTAKSVGSSEGWDDWKRVSQMHPQAHLFCRVTSDDAISNALAGNSWFLSAMACIAEYPAWIVSAFRLNTTLTANGAYAVRFYHPGKQRFQFVEIDDRIPTLRGGPMSAGVTPEGEVWVALLEKAFAKFCGSYKAIEGGSVPYGLLLGGERLALAARPTA